MRRVVLVGFIWCFALKLRGTMASQSASNTGFINPQNAPPIPNQGDIEYAIQSGDIQRLDYYLCRPLLPSSMSLTDPGTQTAVQEVFRSMQGAKIDKMCGKVFEEVCHVVIGLVGCR